MRRSNDDDSRAGGVDRAGRRGSSDGRAGDSGCSDRTDRAGGADGRDIHDRSGTSGRSGSSHGHERPDHFATYARGAARGRIGEDLAALYLAGSGFRIVDRNRRAGRFEVDLLAEHGRELVVVEVRLRAREAHGSPEETVDRRKRARLRSAGRRIWEEHGREELELRFDLVAITLEPRGFHLRHHPRFLDPSGPGAETLGRSF